MNHQPSADDVICTRRDFLQRVGMGFGAMGLSQVDSQASGDFRSPLRLKSPHFPGKAKAVIHLFMNGGPSHVDTFDPKPMLDRYAGKALPMENLRTERKTGAAFASPFKFKQYGQSGTPVSEIFSKVAESADDIAVIRSMHAEVPNHEPSLMLMNCGDARQIRPAMGSWITYGLGSANQNLPGFISMCPGGYPIQESQNWQSGFLPSVYQGTYIDTQHRKMDRLIENIRSQALPTSQQRKQLDLLRLLNEKHLEKRSDDQKLEARIASYELAYRMQMDATDAFDIEREPKHIREMYGEGTQARQMLIARRLIERGVRMVQVWHGRGQPWDNHDDIEVRHRKLAGECDQAIGALLKDLKQRGMLDETLVIWGGEFGRTPTVELPKPGSNAGKINGRDHNHWGFSTWMAGGGVKGGYIHGETDEFGFKAVRDKVHVHDLHATILHLLGFDHEQLTFRHAGRDFRLTDVHGNVINQLLA
ncbi:DUF1501 domain-containing protein [Verrucomicrobia bacterium]|jgi:hypothetical protein|nr:DUF1501 domain-containing protein [Verrucomicrobiota bacterium]